MIVATVACNKTAISAFTAIITGAILLGGGVKRSG
jgi:hypothetical protein